MFPRFLLIPSTNDIYSYLYSKEFQSKVWSFVFSLFHTRYQEKTNRKIKETAKTIYFNMNNKKHNKSNVYSWKSLACKPIIYCVLADYWILSFIHITIMKLHKYANIHAQLHHKLWRYGKLFACKGVWLRLECVCMWT